METVNSSMTQTALPQVPDPNQLSGLITRDTRLFINDIACCGFQPVITLVGLAGNMLSMSVLLHLGVREVTNILLIGLTLVDLLYLIMWYGPMAECIVRRWDPVLAINMEVQYKALPIMVASALGTTSRLYTCLIAVERYIAVLHPLKAPSLLTRQKIFTACLVLTVIPFIFNVHTFMLFDIRETFSADYNTTMKYIVFSQFTVDNVDFIVLYTDLILAIPFNYIPIVLVMYCTVAILVTLHRSRQSRVHMMAGRQDDKQAAEQRQVTKILTSICIVFMVCSLPSICVQVARLLFQKDGYSDVGRYHNLSYVTITISLLFSLINSSVNFIFYIAYSTKFTNTARNICLCWKRTATSTSSAAVTALTDSSPLSDSAGSSG